jgi:hypothetical protein
VLAAHARQYAAFLRARAAGGGAGRAAVASLAVEAVWRAHLLNPQAYARDCTALR